MTRIESLSAVVFFLGVPCLMAVTAAESQNLQMSPANVAEGRRIFELDCAICHGGDAKGGRGPDLTRGIFRHASTDEQLQEILREGIDGTEMPGRVRTDERAWMVVAYLRSLGGGGEIPPGDLQRGREIFFGTGNCSTCHMVSGDGTTQGPDLTSIGYRRSPDYLRTSVLDPNAEVDPKWWTAQVTTISGERATGYLLGEDLQSVRLLDENNHLLAFSKEGLDQFTPVKSSRMPSYQGILNDVDIDNLIAYLVSLRGEGAER